MGEQVEPFLADAIDHETGHRYGGDTLDLMPVVAVAAQAVYFRLARWRQLRKRTRLSMISGWVSR